MADGTPATTADAREAAVLDRIDRVPTAAAAPARRRGHPGARRGREGVGRARRRGVPRGVHRRRARSRSPDAATLDLAHRRAARVQHRLVRRAAAALPGRVDRSSRGARHRQRSRRAGRRPAWLSVAFVIEEGFPVAELATIVADMAEAARPAGVQIVAGDTKVVGRGAADGLLHHHGGRRRDPERARARPRAVQAGDACSCRARIADHGMAVMLARGDLALEADIRSDTAPLGELVERAARGGTDHPLDARPDPWRAWARSPTSWPRDTGARGRARRGGVAGRPGGERRVRPARDRSALRRQRGQVRRRRRPPRRRTPRLPRCAAIRSVPPPRVIGEIAAEPEGIVVLLTTFGGTRIVDMLVGDPLPADLLRPRSG